MYSMLYAAPYCVPCACHFSDFVLLCVVNKAYIAYVKHGSSIGRPLELHLALMGTESLLLQQRTV